VLTFVVTAPGALLRVRFNAAATVLAVAAAAYCAVVSPVLGRRRYARLAAERQRDGRALQRFYRVKLVQQTAMAAAAVAAVTAAPGIGWAGVGLAWPSGPKAAGSLAVAGELVAVALVSGVFFRWLARRGRRVPGQRLFAAMLPRTRDDRWWAFAVAIGAGISEELVCRGLLIAAGIGVVGLSPWGAATAAVVIFGLAHAYQGVAGMVLTAIAAVLFVWLYFTTGSLLPGMVVHAAIDLRGLVMVPEPAARPLDPVSGPAGTR
jgi:membrane protease YdiL (CAAX protease family)